MQSWDVRKIEVPEGTRRAEALETVDGARAIIIRLAAGKNWASTRSQNGLG